MAEGFRSLLRLPSGSRTRTRPRTSPFTTGWATSKPALGRSMGLWSSTRRPSSSTWRPNSPTTPSPSARRSSGTCRSGTFSSSGWGRSGPGQGFLTDARQNFLTYAERQTALGDVEGALNALVEFVELSPEDVEIRQSLASQLESHDRNGRGGRASTPRSIADWSCRDEDERPRHLREAGGAGSRPGPSRSSLHSGWRSGSGARGPGFGEHQPGWPGAQEAWGEGGSGRSGVASSWNSTEPPADLGEVEAEEASRR